MAEKQIVPYGFDLNKKIVCEEALALSILPPKYLAPVPPKVPYDHAYYAQALPCSAIAPPPTRLQENKTRLRERLFDQLDPEPIKVPKDIKILPTRTSETLIEVLTTKDGDTIFAKYRQINPRVKIDGVRAEPGQVKVVPPKPQAKKKKRAPPPPEEQEEKRQRIRVGVLNRRMNDFAKFTQALQHSLDTEQTQRLVLEENLQVLHRYVVTELKK